MKASIILQNIIFGNVCPCCHGAMAVTDPRNMCPQCDELLRRHLYNAPIRINDINITADKFLFSYKYYAAREIVIEMKYKPIRKSCHYFAELAAECIKKDVDFPDFDIITHCPRKPSKKRRIGYDHSESVAQHLAQILDKPFMELLYRHDGGSEQKKMKHMKDRINNVKNKFYFNDELSCRRKRVLIIDDIVTTASTARECARILKEAGAQAVLALFILD